METKKLKPNEPDKVVSDPSPELPWADKDNAIPPAKLGSESGLGSSPDATAKPTLGTDPTTILHSRPEEVGESAEGRTQFEAVVTGQEAAPPLPMCSTATELVRLAIANGLGDEDVSQFIRLYD